MEGPLDGYWFCFADNGTSFYVFPYILDKARPPIISSYKLVCFQISRVSSCFVVMVAG